MCQRMQNVAHADFIAVVAESDRRAGAETEEMIELYHSVGDVLPVHIVVSAVGGDSGPFH